MPALDQVTSPAPPGRGICSLSKSSVAHLRPPTGEIEQRTPQTPAPPPQGVNSDSETRGHTPHLPWLSPGTGKTLLARALANRLGRPPLCARANHLAEAEGQVEEVIDALF